MHLAWLTHTSQRIIYAGSLIRDGYSERQERDDQKE
jgi:hypothetical protein